MRSKRPSLPATIVTVLAGCVLAVGGYVAGNSSGGDEPPARVPLRALAQPKPADPIPVPAALDLPRR